MFVNLCTLPAYMCLQRPEGKRDFENRVKVTVSLLMWVLGLNTGPLEEQNMLLITEHLSSCL